MDSRTGSLLHVLHRGQQLSLTLFFLLTFLAPSSCTNLSQDFFARIIDESRPVSDTARCFSCMSRLYEAVWPSLSSIYKRPKNFTDSCDLDRLEGQGVPYSLCGTICIKMTEEPIVAGIRVRGHIRGCLDDLLINGFNQSIVAWYRWMHRDSCKKYRKRELFKLGPEMSDESSIEVCTCYADHCNGSGVGGCKEMASRTLLLCLFLLLFFLPNL